MPETKKRNEEGEQVRINFRMPVGKPSVTAQHMFAQNLGEVVQLSFFEITFPLVSPALPADQLEAIYAEGVPAECVARVNVPISRYAEFVKAMQKLLDDQKTAKRGKNA